MHGAEASWLVRSSLDRVVWVEPWLHGYIAPRSWPRQLTRHSASLHPGVEMGTGELNAGGNPEKRTEQTCLFGVLNRDSTSTTISRNK